MTIHTRKLPTFALYAAYADESGLAVFAACRDEAINNLAEELAARSGQVKVGAPPSHQTIAGKEATGDEKKGSHAAV